MSAQPAILLPVPAFGHFRAWGVLGNAHDVRVALTHRKVDASIVVGIGPSFAASLRATVVGLEALDPLENGDVFVPVTPHALWAYGRGHTPAEAQAHVDALELALAPYVLRTEDVPGFKFHGGRDLTGFVDGTENPKGEAAAAAAIIADGPLAGGSFVVAQRWVHDMGRFHAHSRPEQEAMIGRTLNDDVELNDSPASSHVHRTAQESYDPPAFMLRRSLPYRLKADDGTEEGLYFVAFATSLDVFNRQMRRMAGLEDGVVDALFTFSKPVTGAAFWCPPVRDGHLDLSAVGV
jgi:putative iron-dependent peroxidase